MSINFRPKGQECINVHFKSCTYEKKILFNLFLPRLGSCRNTHAVERNVGRKMCMEISCIPLIRGLCEGWRVGMTGRCSINSWSSDAVKGLTFTFSVQVQGRGTAFGQCSDIAYLT